MMIVLSNLIFSGLFALLYIFAYCVGTGQRTEQNGHVEGQEKRPLAQTRSRVLFYSCFFVSMLAGFFLCAYVLRQNRFVYYWDYGGYWTSSYSYMKSMFADPINTFRALYQTILYREYNYLLPALLVLPLKLFGYTFTRYVLINYAAFFVPAAYILCRILQKMLEGSGGALPGSAENAEKAAVILPLFPLFFPVFYLAMLQGYVDIACLTPAALSLLLMIDYDPLALDRRQICRDILISLLLLTTVLFRRYFAFFVLGYGVALTALTVYVAATDRNRKLIPLQKRVFFPILNLAVIGAVAGGVMLLLFRPLLWTIIGNSYAEQYAGYDAALAVKIRDLVRTFGWLVIASAFLGLVISFSKRNLRKVSAFCFVSGVVSTGAFFTVQNMGIHHVYIISTQLMILSAVGVAGLVSFPKTQGGRRSIAAAAFLIAALGMANCFFPAVRPALEKVSPLFSKTHNAMQRDDISSLHELADTLNSLTEGTGKKVYICASGAILNGSIMESLDKPYASCAVNNLLGTADVDLRDGFPTQFFSADFVVVTNPIDLHLAKGTQEVVRFLAQEITDGNSLLGRHFTRLSEGFPLDRGRTAYIYQKTSDFEEQDYRATAEYYTALYPNNPELFSDRILGAIE